MIILQLTRDMSCENYNIINNELYNQGKRGLMVLPNWIKLIAITDEDSEKIKIISKDDDI